MLISVCQVTYLCLLSPPQTPLQHTSNPCVPSTPISKPLLWGGGGSRDFADINSGVAAAANIWASKWGAGAGGPPAPPPATPYICTCIYPNLTYSRLGLTFCKMARLRTQSREVTRLAFNFKQEVKDLWHI